MCLVEFDMGADLLLGQGKLTSFLGQLQGFLGHLKGLVIFLLSGKQDGQVEMDLSREGIEFAGGLEMIEGAVQLVELYQGDGEVAVGFIIIGL